MPGLIGYPPKQGYYIMEETIPKPYEAPITLVVEVTTEGTILVASVDQYESIPW